MAPSHLKAIAEELEQTIARSSEVLENIADKEASSSGGDGSWTKKEILGHLIDSAANNHQKFVRAITSAGSSFPGYDQNAWVSAQRYNRIDWNDLVELWKIYNGHLARIIDNVSYSDLVKEIRIDGTSRTLEFLIEDYVVHLNHHLKQIVPETEI